MSQQYHARISDDSLVFSAAHFITVGPKRCERLHGHDYRVAAEVEGSLSDDQWVVDFLLLRKTLLSILKPLDHRVILAGEHPSMQLTESAGEMEVIFGKSRWVFPRANCRVLPIANTTAELLARYLAERLVEELQTRTGRRPSAVSVEVYEGYAGAAICRLQEE